MHFAQIKRAGALGGGAQDGGEVLECSRGHGIGLGDAVAAHPQGGDIIALLPVGSVDSQENRARLPVSKLGESGALPGDRSVQAREPQVSSFQLAAEPSFRGGERAHVLRGI